MDKFTNLKTNVVRLSEFIRKVGEAKRQPKWFQDQFDTVLEYWKENQELEKEILTNEGQEFFNSNYLIINLEIKNILLTIKLNLVEKQKKLEASSSSNPNNDKLENNSIYVDVEKQVSPNSSEKSVIVVASDRVNVVPKEVDSDSESEVIENISLNFVDPIEVKMNFDMKIASSTLESFSGEANKVSDFVNTVVYYESTLKDDTQKELFLKFLYNLKIKGRAKQAFLKEPKTLGELTKKLLDRFKPKETLAQLSKQLGESRQGERSVAKFAGDLEQLTAKINEIQIKQDGLDEETVAKINDKNALSALLGGLSRRIQTVVLAADVDTFEEGVEKALKVEATQTTYSSGGQVNYYRQTRGKPQTNAIRFNTASNNFNRNNNPINYNQNRHPMSQVPRFNNGNRRGAFGRQQGQRVFDRRGQVQDNTRQMFRRNGHVNHIQDEQQFFRE